MQRSEYWRRINELLMQAEMNHLYHQRMQWRFALWDWILRLLVGALSIGALVFAVPGCKFECPGLEFLVAIATVASAIALNVLPVNEWSSGHAELGRRWNALRQQANDLVQHFSTDCPGTDVPDKVLQPLDELEHVEHEIASTETAPWPTLWQQCQRAVQSRVRREGPATCPSSAASPAPLAAAPGPPGSVGSADDRAASET